MTEPTDQDIDNARRRQPDAVCVTVGAKVIATGQKLGKWTILAFPPSTTRGFSGIGIPCRCECGRVGYVMLKGLLNGRSRQCAPCGRASIATHGGSRCGKKHTPLYIAWTRMKARCNPNSHAVHNYYGRGIRVCEEWQKDFASFRAWALANGYREGLTLDRIDNLKGYSPDNCRWTTYTVQGRNKRNNRLLTAFGETKPVSAWAEDQRCKATLDSLYRRASVGWDHEQAITTPNRRLPHYVAS